MVNFELLDDRLLEISKVLFSIKVGTRKYVKWYRILSFARNLSNKYGNQLLHTAARTGIDAQKVVHKTVEGIGKFIGNKIADKIVKPANNSRNVE